MSFRWRFWLKHALIAAALVLMTTATAVYLSWQWLNRPLANLEVGSTFEVAQGESLTAVARRLSEQVDLAYPAVLLFYARIKEQTNIRYGEYELGESVTPLSLLFQLNEGRVKQRSFTLVEGITFAQAVEQIRNLEHIRKEVLSLTVSQLATRLGVTHSNPEGWLYPDTYVYSRQDSDWQLLKRAHQRMTDIMAEEWAGRDAELPYASPYEALIMASIIEKETGAAHERAEIGGVFVRRLQQGMRLQTDPTVIYGLGDSYKGNITRAHLRQKTPYNTYRIDGLPPTPIALPGRDAIHAALHPAQGETLYFVARGDGTHQFSTTLEQHKAAVREYQLKRVKDYRSSVQPQ